MPPLLILIVGLIYATEAIDDKVAVFKKLIDSNQEWMLKTSFPEAAVLLQHPPYSYHTSRENVQKNDSITLSVNAKSSSKSCSDDLSQIIFSLGSDWALTMLDSDGKLNSGILRGGIIWPGHFEECLSAYAPKDAKGNGDFHGQYCATSWSLNLGKKYPILPLTIGLCVPDSCMEENLLTAGRTLIHDFERVPFLKNLTSSINLKSVTCKVKDKSLDTPSIIYLVFVFIFVFLTVIGSAVTVIDWRKSKKIEANLKISIAAEAEAGSDAFQPSRERSDSNKKNNLLPEIVLEKDISNNDKVSLTENVETVQVDEISKKEPVDSVLKRVLLCFSAFENGQKVLNTGSSEGQLLSVHGVRFLSLTWVILGHTYINSISIIGNRLDVIKLMDSFSFQVLLQSPFSVDSFFLLSGFLLAYLFLKEADKKRGKINWIYFYVHRFWRLTPAYMVVVFFYILVFKYVGSGPFWDDDHCDTTRGDWWKYLLYINNFIPINQMCIGWSWYLANDMQFYLISPIFLYPLWRWPVLGLSLLAAGLIGTWTATGVLASMYDVIPMFVGVAQAKDFDAYAKKMWDSFDLIYDKPYTRIAPYLIGIFLGFMLYKANARKNFLTWWQQSLGWILAAFCSLSVVYGLYHVEMSKTTALFYNTLCRSSFTAGLAWLIFACETGHGSFITHILSWKFWIPLSRLTYCAYLVHPILIHGYYQAYQTSLHFTQLVAVVNFLGFLLMSYGLAFLFSLTFESPLMNIEKLLLKSRSK